MAPKFKDIFWARRPEPLLQDDEQIVIEGTAIFLQGQFGARTGPLVLTNRRLIWYETAVAKPWRPIYGEIKLSDVLSVDEGNVLEVIGGGRLRFRLRNGKTKSVSLNDYNLGEWITQIRELIADDASAEIGPTT